MNTIQNLINYMVNLITAEKNADKKMYEMKKSMKKEAR